MFDDYKEVVLLDYKKKRKANAISPNLSLPTPAKLKAECLIVYKERKLSKDENILRSFFGSKDNATDYSQRILKFDIDKFRPLINFLKGRTNETEQKNIQLLAWLIDFEPRPYIYGETYEVGIEEELGTESFINSKHTESRGSVTLQVNQDASPFSGVENQNIDESKIIPQRSRPLIIKIASWKTRLSQSRVRSAVISFIAVVVASSGAYLLLSTKNQQCMYWTGDHYQAIACDQKIGDTSIIALDSTKIAHLKKITRQDTLTQNSMGKVWYSKIDGKLEFYTSTGFHPVHNERRLRPITPYILDKYIFKIDTINLVKAHPIQKQ